MINYVAQQQRALATATANHIDDCHHVEEIKRVYEKGNTHELSYIRELIRNRQISKIHYDMAVTLLTIIKRGSK